jgi:thymidylate synthase
MNMAFAIADVVWIMTGRNDLAFLEAWNSRLREFVGPGPRLHGAYGYRLRHHRGLDQLARAYEALKHNPDTRQIALQIWDSSIDLPTVHGVPADLDIPCNVMSLLKVRDGKLEWLQIVRSNDLFLGVPHNFVQFTCLQEIMAGWLNIDCGAYHQISDSLHLYRRDEANVLASYPLTEIPYDTDSLAVPREVSEWAFDELGRKMEQMIKRGLSRKELERLCEWNEVPQGFRNMQAVLGAEVARRHRWADLAAELMSNCTNPLYVELWSRWLTRTESAHVQE